MLETVANLVVLGIVVIAATVVILRQGPRDTFRSNNYRELAKSLNLTYERNYHGIFADSFFRMPMFGRGWDGAAFNTFRGILHINDRPFPVQMGDFRYTIGDGDKEHDDYFSYLIVQLLFAGVPDTIIRAEAATDRLASQLGLPDINFESAEFSRVFHVQSKSRRFAFDLLHGPAMEFLLDNRPRRIEITDGHLVMGDGIDQWSTKEFREAHRSSAGFLKCWPRHLADLLDSGRWLDEEQTS